MKTAVEPTWNEWLEFNLKQGSCPLELLDILVQNGFTQENASRMLNSARQLLGTSSDDKNQPDNATIAESAIDSATQQALDHDDWASHEIFLPTALKINNDDVDMYGVDSFLCAAECQHLILLIRANQQRSTTSDEGVSELRTGKTFSMASLEDAVVQDIDRRICQYVGIDPSQSEPIQGQWYEEGQQSRAHTDYFDPDSPTFEKQMGSSGQRTWTFTIYLNTTREGGSTFFPKLDLNIEPQAGTALIWNNKNKHGELNPFTLHHETRVQAGYKAVITKWFRCVDKQPYFTKTPNEIIPPLTRDGFIKSAMPAPLHKTLLDYYLRQRLACEDESVPGFIHSIAGEAPSVLVELNDELRQQVHHTMQPMIEAWIGDYVIPTHVYGIREYRHGSILTEHRDRLVTHIAGAILNIDQEVNEDWPLVIEDHHCRRHQILLKPGEMILYESASLQHGRPTALNGSRYANVFVHFKRANKEIQQ